MKKIGALFCLMSMLCLLCSCSKDNEEVYPEQEESVEDRLIGTWLYKEVTRERATYSISESSRLTFYRGGKFTFKGESMTPWIDFPERIIDIEGTYYYDKEKCWLVMVRSAANYSLPVYLYFGISFATKKIVLRGENSSYSSWIWEFEKE